MYSAIEAMIMTLMTVEGRWEFLGTLDEELLQGGVILSEWCSFITNQADIAFAGGAFLASILTAVSGIETYLRSEYSPGRNCRLADLIDQSPIADDLKLEMHALRKYRNSWVHVDDPWSDEQLLEKPEEAEQDLQEMTVFAMRVLRKTIYENPWI